MQSALVIIDVQVGIVGGPPKVHDAPRLLRHLNVLIEQARRHEVPVVFVQHDGPEGHRTAVGSPGHALHPELSRRPDDLVVHKHECDSFLGTELDAELRSRGIDALVVAGLMTEYCIDTTCRRAFSLGYDVTLVADAHSTADRKTMSAEAIVAHHNSTLDEFGTGDPNQLRVRPLAEVVSSRFAPEGGRAG